MVTKTQCPECAKRGKDNHKDNLVIFDNGAGYCFSCSYYQYKDKVYLKNKKPLNIDPKLIALPWDITNHLPEKVLQYLNSFYLTRQEIKENNILWSDYYQRVYFPIFSNDILLAWQGRYLGDDTKKSKWFSQGNLKDILHVIKPKRQSNLVLTEDIISAIRVGSQEDFCASPLFGSNISAQQFQRYNLNLYPNKIFLWLDKDKEFESYKFTNKARQLGIPCVTIVTDRDPKTYTHIEIKRILKVHM